jgi:hypothetical protein
MIQSKIPITPKAQKLPVTILGTLYVFILNWSVVDDCWMLDITDSSYTLFLSGLPLILNTNLLYPYYYLNLGFVLFVQSDNDIRPSYSNLGSIANLYLLTP